METETLKKKNVEAVPKLRFKEYFINWKKRKIGDFVQDIKGGAPLKPSDFRKNSKWKVIPKKAIIAGGKLTLGNNHTYCSENFFHTYPNSVINNQFLVTTLRDLVPSGPSIGYIVRFIDDTKYILAQGVYGIKLNGDKLIEDFLIQYSNSLKYRRVMQKIMVGSTQVHIRNKEFLKVPIYCPAPLEQQKIATFLSAVDKKLQQLTRKKALLETYKKGVMQKLFSQEIRFKDYNSSKNGILERDFPEWEEKKLGQVLKIGSGKDYKHLGEGDIPVLGTGGTMTYVNDYLYEGESVGIGRKGTIDKPVYLTGKFWTVDTLFYTHSFNKVLPKFVYIIFQQINWRKHNEASGVPSLSKATIETIKVKIPCLEEQQKIANFLSAIDKKSEAVSQQIDKMQSFKKGLLQQMFV